MKRPRVGGGWFAQGRCDRGSNAHVVVPVPPFIVKFFSHKIQPTPAWASTLAATPGTTVMRRMASPTTRMALRLTRTKSSFVITFEMLSGLTCAMTCARRDARRPGRVRSIAGLDGRVRTTMCACSLSISLRLATALPTRASQKGNASSRRRWDAPHADRRC
jgi:hypothetical protein